MWSYLDLTMFISSMHHQNVALAIATLFWGIVKSIWIFFRGKYVIDVVRMTI